MRKFDWVFFDSGGTLFAESGGDPPQELIRAQRFRRARAAMAGLGVDADPRRLEKVASRLERELPARLGVAYSFLELMEAVIAEMELPLGPEDAACLADAYAGPRYESWLFPGTKQTLASLSEAGVKLGLIANTAWCSFSMDRSLAGTGLLKHLYPRLYSAQLGLAKPDIRIFRLAERLATAAGERICYIGNDLEADIRGAAAAGWSTGFRRSTRPTSAGAADFEFDESSELLFLLL